MNYGQCTTVSNQMAWDNHTEMIEMAAMYAEYVFGRVQEEQRKKEIRAIQKELNAMDRERCLKESSQKK